MRFLLHISFDFHGRKSDPNELRPAFDRAIDWVRYAPNCWIVCTTSEPKIWYQRLKPLLHDEDLMLICEVGAPANRIVFSGYLPEFVWTWLRKVMPTSYGRPPTASVPVLPILSLPDEDAN